MTKEEILQKINKGQLVDLIKELFFIYDMKELDIEEIEEKNYDTSMLDIKDKYFEYNYSEIISYENDDELIDTYAQKLTEDDLNCADETKGEDK